jgi:hypothetical protein
MNEIQDTVLYKLGRIEASLDEIKVSQADLKTTMTAHSVSDAANFDKHDKRLRSLENTRTRALGFIAAVATVSPMLAHWIEKTLHLA